MRQLIVLLTILSLTFVVCTRQSGNSLAHIPYRPTPATLKKPDRQPDMLIPADNPLTVEGIALGRKLFYDPILSADSTVFCGNCHQQKRGFTDGKAVSTGFAGRKGVRSAMSLVNVGFHTQGLFWDGRAATLEAQAVHPVQDTVEMNLDWRMAEQRLQRHDNYPILFRQAFGIKNRSEITQDLVVKALAQFQRTLVSRDAKFDQVQRGEAQFTEAEARGYAIFFDTSDELPHSECGHCHVDPLFATPAFENNGIQAVQGLHDFADAGRGTITGNRYDNGKFKVPTLRNIAQTAPYMHDGRFKTLDEVLDHYASGGHFADNLSPNVRQLRLGERDKQDLIAFLHTLTDSVLLNNPAFANPF
ncbi:MAG TPA: cytochrome c peroxidase [Saprospiraceae bacterium]|nr:cytochrome c peroxidase [Saprospiraceae bacterium]HMP24199.1 cytochrome c peroxidase [Saprospiraceae bacterium]